MQLVSIDGSVRTLKNQSVDKARLAENIRTARAKLRLSRKGFAAVAGITTNTLRALENGTHAQMPDVQTLQKVAKACTTTVEELIGGTVTLPAETDGLHREDLRIARAYHEAIAEVKTATKRLLLGDQREEALEQVAILLQHLLTLAPALLPNVASVVSVATNDPETFEILHDLVQEKLQARRDVPVKRDTPSLKKKQS